MDSTVTRSQFIAEARTWLGTPYHNHASLKGVGVDCAGLPRGLAQVFGIPMPVYSEEERNHVLGSQWFLHSTEEHFLHMIVKASALETIAPDAIRPADILVFGFGDRPSCHAGILSTPTHFIHALYGKEVRETPLVPRWQPLLRATFTIRGIIDDLP